MAVINVNNTNTKIITAYPNKTSHQSTQPNSINPAGWDVVLSGG